MNTIAVKGDENNPLKFFSELSVKLKGDWNGEEFTIDNEYGEIRSVTFKYLKNLYIGITEIDVKQEFTFENEPVADQHFVNLRIGKVGEFNADTINEHQKDSIYVYNSQQKFKIIFSPHIKMKWLFIRFPKELYDLLGTDRDSEFYELISNPKPWFFYSPMLPEIEVLIQDIYESITLKTIRRGIFLSKSIELITKLRAHGYINKFKNIAYDIHPDDLDAMLLLKDEILNDFTKTPNVIDISKEKGMSKSKLQRSFKSVFQMPLLQFFNQQRILEGQKQIRETTKDFTQIAFELGYTDLSHFSRVYKKLLGKRPSEEVRKFITPSTLMKQK